jgi:predicted secreted protein
MSNELHSKSLVLKYNSTAIARVDNFSFVTNKGTVEITNFDSNDWREFLAGLKDFQITFSGMVVRDAGVTNDYDDLLNELMTNDTPVAMNIFDSVASKTIAGNVIINTLTLQAAVGEAQKYNGTLQGTGALTNT